MDYLYYKSAYLAHHGIKGQKWGIRRYQNPDGSWTEAGRRRRGVKSMRRALTAYNKGVLTEDARKLYAENAVQTGKYAKALNRFTQDIEQNREYARRYNSSADVDKTKGNITRSNINRERAKQYEASAKAGEQIVKDLMRDAKKNGLEISSKETKRLIERYEHGADARFISTYVLGLPGALVTTAATLKSVDSVKYKQRKQQ